MELYLPYVIGSSFSVIIGNITYGYLYSYSNQTNELNEGSNIEYDLIDIDLYERIVDSNRSINNIGVCIKDKINNLQTILLNECNKSYPINNTRKIRNRWIRRIKEYETKGHTEFVYRYSKK